MNREHNGVVFEHMRIASIIAEFLSIMCQLSPMYPNTPLYKKFMLCKLILCFAVKFATRNAKHTRNQG